MKRFVVVGFFYIYFNTKTNTRCLSSHLKNYLIPCILSISQFFVTADIVNLVPLQHHKSLLCRWTSYSTTSGGGVHLTAPHKHPVELDISKCHLLFPEETPGGVVKTKIAFGHFLRGGGGEDLKPPRKF